MSLRDKLSKPNESSSVLSKYKNFGVVNNPFPTSSQPTGHPHLEADVDIQIVASIKQFEDYGHATQVIVVEGTQGVGKTNLLNYYQNELEDYYRDEKGFYIIRYYPDPEPSFDSILRKVFQAFGENHFREIGVILSQKGAPEQETIINIARSSEVRAVLHSLSKAAKSSEDALQIAAQYALEWFLGLRIYKRYTEALGVFFKLDTVESRTQALRDIVYVSYDLGILNGIFLLLDELEKQDYSQSKTTILRYLSAIRALIDSLPKNLFLMLALTPSARSRYFLMLPAIAGRLQNIVVLRPIQNDTEALNLYAFYEKEERERAANSSNVQNTPQGKQSLIAPNDVKRLFDEMLVESADRGLKGVTHRDFLQRLHSEAEKHLAIG